MNQLRALLLIQAASVPVHDPLPDRLRGKPGSPPALRNLGEPSILNHLSEFVPGELADPARSKQHRRMTVEVCSREER
jgi:hypothetical protein